MTERRAWVEGFAVGMFIAFAVALVVFDRFERAWRKEPAKVVVIRDSEKSVAELPPLEVAGKGE